MMYRERSLWKKHACSTRFSGNLVQYSKKSTHIPDIEQTSNCVNRETYTLSTSSSQELSVLCCNKPVIHPFYLQRNSYSTLSLLSCTPLYSPARIQLRIIAVEFLLRSENGSLQAHWWEDIIWMMDHSQHNTLTWYWQASVLVEEKGFICNKVTILTLFEM